MALLYQIRTPRPINEAVFDYVLAPQCPLSTLDNILGYNSIHRHPAAYLCTHIWVNADPAAILPKPGESQLMCVQRCKHPFTRMCVGSLGLVF